jgi:hypothetical protein
VVNGISNAKERKAGTAALAGNLRNISKPLLETNHGNFERALIVTGSGTPKKRETNRRDSAVNELMAEVDPPEFPFSSTKSKVCTLDRTGLFRYYTAITEILKHEI